MAKYRRGRINDEVKKEMAGILRDVKDPRVRDAFISITAAEVTPDLKYAKIYYSHLRGDTKEVAKGLKSSAGYIRHMLAQRMNLRITPELTFITDSSIANGAHISSLINGLTYSDDGEQNEQDDVTDEDTKSQTAESSAERADTAADSGEGSSGGTGTE